MSSPVPRTWSPASAAAGSRLICRQSPGLRQLELLAQMLERLLLFQSSLLQVLHSLLEDLTGLARGLGHGCRQWTLLDDAEVIREARSGALRRVSVEERTRCRQKTAEEAMRAA